MPTWLNGNAYAMKVEDIYGALMTIAPGNGVQSYEDLLADNFTQSSALPNPKVTMNGNLINLTFVITAAAGGTVADIDIPAAVMKQIKGKYLVEAETIPGAGDLAPTSTYTVDITNSRGQALLGMTGRSVSAAEVVGGHDTLTYFPPIDDTLTIATGDLGASNQATLILKFDTVPWGFGS